LKTGGTKFIVRKKVKKNNSKIKNKPKIKKKLKKNKVKSYKKVKKSITVKIKKEDRIILKLINFQNSLKPKFKIKLNLNFEKYIQGFFDKIANTIDQYRVIKKDEARRIKVEKQENERRYEDAIPCVYQLVTKVVPKNQPPIDRYAQGRSKRPDQPMNTNRSLINQSSSTSNQPLVGACKVDATIIFSYEKGVFRPLVFFWVKKLTD